MDISRKTDYALRMLAMLAEDPERLLSVRTAAEEVNVPYSFARSIQHGLVQAGIVESLRGVHGGMRLKVSPDDVTIRQVVEAVQGPMVMNDCTAPDGDCARMGTSLTASSQPSIPSSPTAKRFPSTPPARALTGRNNAA